MKSAIEYRNAVRRGWRLLVLLAVLGAVVGLVRPTSPSSDLKGGWLAGVDVQQGPGVSLHTLLVDAANPQVVQMAAQNAGIPTKGLSAASVKLVRGKRAGTAKKVLELSVVAKNEKRAVPLAYNLAGALQSYVDDAAQATYNNQVQANNQLVSCLEDELSNIQSDITAEEQSPGSVNTSNLFGDSNSGGYCGGTSASDSDSSGSSDDSSSNVSSAQPVLDATGKSTTSTAQPSKKGSGGDSGLTTLVVAKAVVTNRLHSALSAQANLAAKGAPSPAVTTVSSPYVFPAGSTHKALTSLANNRMANVFGGGFVGMLLAAGIVVAVETLDRSLRSVRQVETAFELPVVATVPLPAGVARRRHGDPPPPPRLDVALDPASAASESYRELRTAVLIEPLVSERAAVQSPYASSAVYGVPQASGFDPQGASPPGPQQAPPRRDRAPRRVILVVSAHAEPTRPSVIANLAATYAETGERALVVTVSNLGWHGTGGALGGARAGQSEFAPADIVPLSSPTMVAGVRRLAFDQILASRGQVPSFGPAVIAAARDVADVVIIDGLGLVEARDALVLLPEVDVVVVVAEFGVTTTPDAKQTSEILRRFSAPVLGVVFTNTPPEGKPSSRRPVANPAAQFSRVLLGEESTLVSPLTR
ncbi:MAG TPA: hypothetical protein VK386_09910 [Acidimicrobiales bacterium]|nr:hypothetical protein [Acidimicrobiales bacterium]